MSIWYDFPVLPNPVYFGIEARIWHNPNLNNNIILILGFTMLPELAFA
jgi:hypothetical protein